MEAFRQVTGFDAGFSGDEQIRIALQRIVERGGETQIVDLYEAVNERLRPLPFGCLALFYCVISL